IGLHAGPVILGEMGYRQATTLTAIGDTVNVASRLEALTKEFGAELVVSSGLVRQAGVDLNVFETSDVEIRGRKRPLRVHVVTDAKTMPVTHEKGGGPKPTAFSLTRWLTLGSANRAHLK
ncbi:MAG: adenylate/guanylate cyclase domain-containing protein, partial [Geminicoccaceae bacterium]